MVAIEKTGIGLHSGVRVCVRVLPANPSEGRYFVRTDLPGSPIVPADIASVSDTQLSTQLSANGASVRTVEHLLAALAAMGVSDARIEIDGPEVPLLDGSAREWVEGSLGVWGFGGLGGQGDKGIFSDQWPVTSDQFKEIGDWGIGGLGGIQPQTSNLEPRTSHLGETIAVREEDAFVAAIPSPQLRFTYGIDFPAAAIGQQWHTWTPTTEPFDRDIAPARTFCLAEQVESLRQAGLIKGGSLDNALVCQGDRWLNPPLRFANEPARHKILDLVGDLSLLGNIPTAHFVAYKASHRLHARLARLLQERRTSRSH